MREAQVRIRDTEFSELGIDELVTLAQEAGIREMEELACYGNSAVIQLDVESRLDESRLDNLAYVEEFERVAESAKNCLYIVAFTAPALSATVAETAADLVGTCEPEIEDGAVTVSFSGSQEAIADTISEYEDRGVSPELRKLGAYDGGERPLDVLTDRQREVIETAFEMGYYEVPRETATEDVAGELGLDPSTVAEHLQRAERNLISKLLSSD